MSKQSVTVYRGRHEVIGWVSHGDGCQNAACKRAMRDGRMWHAIPGAGVTLADYHYATQREAVAAIKQSMLGQKGHAV